MADSKANHLPHVSTKGTTQGRPNFEASPHFKLTDIVIGYGQPRLYDEVATQWYAVAQELDDMRSALESLDVQTMPCGARAVGEDGDETPAEAAFNDALEEMLFGRLRIETADGYDQGLAHWLGWLVHPACWGAGLAAPYYDAAGGMNAGAHLYVRPMELSAVDRFLAERGDGTPASIRYRTVNHSVQEIAYNALVHVTTVGSRPGHWFGYNPVFRSLTSLFVQWRQLVIQKAGSYMTSGGVLAAKQQADAGTVSQAETEQMLIALRALESGETRSIITTPAYDLQVLSPSGTMPDWRTEEEGLAARVKERFSNAAATLGLSTHGSRAVADTMSDEDKARAAKRRNSLVNRGWMRLAQWVARQEGYEGRIRTLTTVEEDAGIDLATVPAIVQAKQAGLIDWTEQDAAWLRKGLGLPELEERPEEPQTPRATPPTPERQQAIADALPAAQRAAGIQQTNREHTHTGQCCPPSTTLAEDDESDRFLIGAPGSEKEHYRPALVVSIHGTEIRPELYHAWADEDEERHTLDVTVTQQIEEIAGEHRRAVWQTLELMTPEEYRPDHPALVEVYDDFQRQYGGLIDGYVERVRQSAFRQAQSTAQRQIDSVNPGQSGAGIDMEAAKRRSDEQAERARNAGRAAAETTANRVQSEVESAWNGGVLPAGFTSRISAKGLSQQARQAGNAAEVSGGMQAATDESTTPDGWRIVALVRTSMMDGDVCAHCRSEDGATFIENEEGVLVKADSIGATPEGTPWANYPPLPDSGRCFGGPACRCRWLPVYGR
ncbi:MAG: hypothetical protein HRU13_08360 [Phycisphaerales bacterium]|nr:hypothetical protein [Phycisphaerales bacterium]